MIMRSMIRCLEEYGVEQLHLDEHKLISIILATPFLLQLFECPASAQPSVNISFTAQLCFITFSVLTHS